MTQDSRDQIVRKLLDNMGAIKRGMAGHINALHSGYPVTRGHLELLFAIWHTQPVCFKDLARQLYLTPGAVSQLAEGLEQLDLISRHAEALDRRVQCLRVTKRGEKLLQKVKKQHEQIMTKIIEDVSDNDLAAWLRVQEKMLQHFQTEHPQQITQEAK